MQHYDIIITGGGAAGLSLAYHLVHSSLHDRSILIVDRSNKDRNDRTWGFWTNQATCFDAIVYRSWDRLQVVGDTEATIDLHDYRYQMIRGIDFYHFVQQTLSAYPNVHMLHGLVEAIEDGPDAARVTVAGQTFSADWVFDSTLKATELRARQDQRHYLQLHFKGWEIETPTPAFDPEAATLMDFRTPQHSEARFFYVLPLSERRALVEFTAFSTGRYSRQEYDQALHTYLTSVLGISEYQIVAEEQGVIPATDCHFARRAGQRVMTIGTKAGQVKPTTGYAFLRIQQDSAAIVQSLLQTGHPFAVPETPRSYRLLDSIMLHVMQTHGEQIKPVFAALFRKNPIERIFRFLDERATLRDSLALIVSMPPRLFLQAAWQQLLPDRTRPVAPQRPVRATS